MGATRTSTFTASSLPSAPVYTDYADPNRNEWITKIQPALKKAKLKALVEVCAGKPKQREIIELRARRSKPHPKNQELIVTALKKLGLI